MGTAIAADRPPTASQTRVPLWPVWAPLLVLITLAVTAMAAGVLIDASGLHQSSGSWGYTSATAFLVSLFGCCPLGGALVVALAGTVTRTSRNRHRWTLTGLILAGVTTAAVLVACLIMFLEPQTDQAGHVISAAVIAVSATVPVPLVAAYRRSARAAHHSTPSGTSRR